MELREIRTVSTGEMARILGISRASLDKQRCVNPEAGPPFVRMGRRILYPVTGAHGFEAWLAARVEGGSVGNGG